MAYVSNFTHDLFVSYAHFDNEEDAQDVRWVSRFQADLRNALRQRLGEEAQVFFDSRSFEASDHVDFLVENARDAAVFVAVLSPSYVAREFTIKELQAFSARAPDVSRHPNRRKKRIGARREMRSPLKGKRVRAA